MTASELDYVFPFLASARVAPLIWWKLRGSKHQEAAVVHKFHDAYRFSSVRAELDAADIKSILATLRSAGIEPLLIKGWSVARLYPEIGLRPYGDIDLLVRPGQLDAAERALKGLRCHRFIDFEHSEISEFDERSFDELNSRSRHVPLGDSDVRVLAPEDLLRMLCIHALKHGVWDPLWLCDIGLCVESAPADFDWELCIGDEEPQSQWVSCAITLAHRLLYCHLPAPILSRVETLPAWLESTVVRSWAHPIEWRDTRLAVLWNRPSDFARGLKQRWLSPIEVAVRTKSALREGPQFAYQLAEFLSPKKIAPFARELLAELRRR